MTLFSTIKDAFEIEGRGLVLTFPASSVIPRNIKNKEQIHLIKPDGSKIETRIEAIEMIDGREIAPIAFLVSRSLQRSDIPSGTELWLVKDET